MITHPQPDISIIIKQLPNREKALSLYSRKLLWQEGLYLKQRDHLLAIIAKHNSLLEE